MTHHDIIKTAFGWWLAAGCRTYGASPHEIASRIKPFAEILADVDPETLKAACQRCANTCKDFPSVADVREAVAALREERRALPEAQSKAHDDCAACGGSGWEPASDGVQRCRCTKGLSFPRAAERTNQLPEVKKMLAEAVSGREM